MSPSTCSGCRLCNSGSFTGWSAGAFFSFGHDRIGTDVQHPCGVTNATCIESHLDNLLFDRRRLPRVALIQEAGTTGTLVLAAAIPWLPLAGLAMADDVGPLTVGTVQDLEDHDATRSR
jgi:hypothetical protein